MCYASTSSLLPDSQGQHPYLGFNVNQQRHHSLIYIEFTLRGVSKKNVISWVCVYWRGRTKRRSLFVETIERCDTFYDPSLPNCSVHSEFLSKSSLLTVGREFRIALMKSFTTNGGSNSFSESTSIQLISMAPLSPGEHGVSFSTSSTRT